MRHVRHVTRLSVCPASEYENRTPFWTFVSISLFAVKGVVSLAGVVAFLTRQDKDGTTE